MTDKIEHIQQYYQKVKSANKELIKKEAFKDLLNRLYFGNADIRQIIDKMTMGAETSVWSIPRNKHLFSGRADSLFNNIIIEFKNNLPNELAKIKQQLGGYLLGMYKEENTYNYTLIASDCITWKVFVPDFECLCKLDTITAEELILREAENSSFTLTPENAEEFYYWIDRFLFQENKQKATLKNIEMAFGQGSSVFVESYKSLNEWFNDAKKYGEIQVSFEQWHKFLSIAYGQFDRREDAFLIHTYLSVFAKILAFQVLEKDEFIDDDKMLRILNGEIFQTKNIVNFVDNDFFHWITNERNFPKLKKVFRLIAQELSTFDFENVQEDILKGVYQELIDLDTRHKLGEYYTPDWLCERIVSEFDFDKCKKILDPSCGSGSFLRAAIQRIKQQNPEKTPEEINKQIYGIDIHPLSVQIAKTTVLLALGKEVKNAQKPVFINILLANTLYSPVNEGTLFGNDFEMPIDRKKYKINSLILNNISEFNQAIDICDQLSSHGIKEKQISLEDFTNILYKHISNGGANGVLASSYYEIYKGFRATKEQKRDSIWKFIISNQYKPYFLHEFFDYIIGNPPWFTYSSIKNEDYQVVLNKLAEKYNVKPIPKNLPHLEIAAIFLSHCSSYFLKENGKIAFVLPRSFFSGEQHDRTRNGEAKGFKITEIWDLDKVQPLFNIPSCVFIAEKKTEKQNGKMTVREGKQFEGRLPVHNCHYDVAEIRLKETSVKWYLKTLGKTTAFSTAKSTTKNVINPYKSQFYQGATIVPRAFYFVDFHKDKPKDLIDRIISIQTAKDVQTDAKAPWKLQLSGQIESKFIFRTAISKSILPFYLYNPSMIVLPITIEKEKDALKRIILHSSRQLMMAGELKAWRWFQNTESIWDYSKTEKSGNIYIDRLNFYNKLTDQNLNIRYLVLYTASAKDAHALVVDRTLLDLEFFVESTTYVYYSDNILEAYYLATILNSSIPNRQIKDFQAKGLFGPRHVHKKILDVYFPEFNNHNKLHLQLSDLGKLCAEKAKAFVENNPPQNNLSAHSLGKLRVEIKKHLSKELGEIDKIVEKIMKEK